MEDREYGKLMRGLLCVRKVTDFAPKVALVLGSGLGGYVSNIRVSEELPYSLIDEMPLSTVPGHEGKYIFGTIGDVPVVCMKGRVHYYEGYTMEEVVRPIRLMNLLGAQVLILTNAAGGINDSFKRGDLMLIRDQISCFVPNPLIGPNIDELGTRFPDMSHIYDEEIQNIVRNCAASQKITLKEGVYVQLSGPSYESPAEIDMLRRLGADAVGMSTAVEAIAARHMGMRVCGISCISNMAAGIEKSALDHKEVQMAADDAAPYFSSLLTACIGKIEI